MAGRAIVRHSFYVPNFGQDLVIYLDANTIRYSARAVLGEFHLQWRTGSQSWRGLDVVSHLMRWRYFILTHPPKCEITPTENIFTFLGGLYMGNLQAFILWSKVWFGPRHSCWCRAKKLLRSTLGLALPLFQLHWRTCSKSWPGLDGWSRNNDTSHLMR